MKKILLVDDSSTMLLLEKIVLQSAGYQILVVRDVEAGARAALVHRPDLILLETDPPEGFPSGGNPVIILTKPIDDNELLARVKSLLGD
jgi:DNA-binding response OmpR family regulator